MTPFLTEAVEFLSEDDSTKKQWIQRRARLVCTSDGERKRSASSPESNSGKRKRPVSLPLLEVHRPLTGEQDDSNHVSSHPLPSSPRNFPATEAEGTKNTTPNSPGSTTNTSQLKHNRDTDSDSNDNSHTCYYGASCSSHMRNLESESVSDERKGRRVQRGKLERLPTSVHELEGLRATQKRFGMSPKHDDVSDHISESNDVSEHASEGTSFLWCSESLGRSSRESPSQHGSAPTSPFPSENSTGPDPNSGTRPLDLACYRDRLLSWDNYDYMLEKAFSRVRAWWFNYGTHVKLVLKELEAQLCDTFKIATGIVRQQIHESENGKRLLDNLKTRDEHADLHLDLLINAGITWRDNGGPGGMRWCLDYLEQQLPLLLNRCRVQRPVSDDEATATSSGK
ncbi:MAG: hypothetical protein [Ara ararauna aveparvovirus]|uniref:Uncharacterized protein n=2 Tax=Parvoviridae TaxID=10780 RepID=A0A7D3UK64_9VIRU|nr:MAG: hypothetical protein [Parvoviridae sp.]QTE03876.1 MAG: hypothetical protein [Ara ararauna aveparvovirus]